MQHVFIIGAKGLGNYGGYESFLDKLTEYHQHHPNIKYHIACKINGSGKMDESKLKGVKVLSDTEFEYHNAHCFKLKAWDVGSAQAILYDIKALKYCCNYVKKHHVDHPIVYILSSRIGFFVGYYAKKIHKYGGVYIHNSDGLEFKRGKYSFWVRKYWKISEKLMVKNSDLEISDSKNIEKYICEEYADFKPKTVYIAYGAEVRRSTLQDDDSRFVEWLKKFDLSSHGYYLLVGRFVPENNFETMIKEFMRSSSKRDFAIITNVNGKFLRQLECRLHFQKDKRIKFVGTVYDKELLMKIREHAFAYIHGHEVGGTNPSLLEALSSTELNLLLDVAFNREVAGDAALYWDKGEYSLASLINESDVMPYSTIKMFGQAAKERIINNYSWEFISEKYAKIFTSE